MSKKEIEDLKTLIKALDIRLKNDEISQEEYDNLKAKYEVKLDEEMQIVKDKSFLKDLSYISISGSGKVTDSYISISGSGKVDGWKGGSISISGSGKITDEEIKISGSASLPGDMETNTLKVSGSLKTNGSLETTIVSCSGSMKISGDLIAHEKMTISGSGKIEGDIMAGKLHSSGSIEVEGTIECHLAVMNGSFNVEGDVNCQESFTSSLGSNQCIIEGNLICGSDVHIEKDKRRGALRVKQVIAKGNVYLEGVTADYVCGKKVELGSDCRVEKIEEKANLQT